MHNIIFHFLAIIICYDIRNSRAKFHNDLKLNHQVTIHYIYNKQTIKTSEQTIKTSEQTIKTMDLAESVYHYRNKLFTN